MKPKFTKVLNSVIASSLVLMFSISYANADTFNVDINVSCDTSEASISPEFDATASTAGVSESAGLITINVEANDTETLVFDLGSEAGQDCDGASVDPDVYITYGEGLEAAAGFLSNSCAVGCTTMDTSVSISIDPFPEDEGAYTGTIEIDIASAP
jgi:hypothetical protein